MGKLSRRKGAEFEREVVRAFKSAGFKAERRAGLQANPLLDQGDVFVDNLGRIECKRRASSFKTLYEWMKDAEAVVIRTDHKPALIVFELNDWLIREIRDEQMVSWKSDEESGS